MIKRYAQFLLESTIYDDIKSYFDELIDGGMIVDVDDVWFEEIRYPTMGTRIVLVDYADREEYQLIFSGERYHKGYKITIGTKGDKDNRGDNTLDFKASVSQIIGLGTNLSRISTIIQTGNEIDLSLEDIEIKDGKIYIDLQDGIMPVDSIDLYFNEDQEFKATDVDVAEYYYWSDWEKDDNNNIFFDIEIGHLVDLFVKEKSQYYKILSQEDHLYDYYNGEYSPKPKEVPDYYINKENIIKMISIFIRKCGGWDKFTVEYSDIIGELSSLDQEDFLVRVIKQSRILKDIFSHAYEENDELIDEVRFEIGGYLSSAHAHKNEQEIWDAFYDMLDKHFVYTKIRKDVIRRERLNKMKGPKVPVKTWTENVECLRIKFDNDWIRDSSMDIMSESLESIFSHWASEMILSEDKEIKPFLSDYASPDEEGLNKEISFIISYH